MGIPFTVNLERTAADIIRDLGAGARLEWARDNTSSTGTFTDASGNTPLVTGQDTYELYDSTGAEGHWYRTRVATSTGTQPSQWSAIFQAGSFLTYADIDDLREQVSPADTSNDNLLWDVLRRATARIDSLTSRSFFRVPAISGTTTRTYNTTGEGYIEDDFLLVTTVSYATATGQTLTALVAADWYLEPVVPRTGWPYTALYLSDVASVTKFYEGYRTVSVVGAFGWSAVPADIENACLDLAREMYHYQRGGRTIGLEFGRLPASVLEVVSTYKRRSFAFV